jgi:DNA-binding response OmpR family regulator
VVAFLGTRPEHVFTGPEIMRHLNESDYVAEPRTVDVHVRNIRRKIEQDPAAPGRLVSVRGVANPTPAR